MTAGDDQKVADFLSTVNIREVIGNAKFRNTPKPCPKCHTNVIYIHSDQVYRCSGCDDWGTTAQYLIEREGLTPWEAVVEIAFRTNRPLPLEPVDE